METKAEENKLKLTNAL